MFGQQDPRWRDAMGGTAANRLTLADALGSYGNPGASGGEQRHTMTTGELVQHSHSLSVFNSGSGGGGAPISSNNTNPAGAQTTGNAGSTTPFNLISPTQVANYMIKT